MIIVKYTRSIIFLSTASCGSIVLVFPALSPYTSCFYQFRVTQRYCCGQVDWPSSINLEVTICTYSLCALSKHGLLHDSLPNACFEHDWLESVCYPCKRRHIRIPAVWMRVEPVYRCFMLLWHTASGMQGYNWVALAPSFCASYTSLPTSLSSSFVSLPLSVTTNFFLYSYGLSSLQHIVLLP